MPSAKLKLLQRQVLRREQQAPAPVEEHGVGSVIERLISEEVSRRVSQAVEYKPPPQVQRLLDQQFNRHETYTSFEQLPPQPRAATPKAMQGSVQRDGAGVARAMVVNGQRFLLQRDAAGQLVGFIGEDLASEVSYDGKPVPPAEANRKLYGNDEAV